MIITDLLHKTFGKEAETVLEDIAANILPQVKNAVVSSAAELAEGHKLVITVEVIKKV